MYPMTIPARVCSQYAGRSPFDSSSGDAPSKMTSKTTFNAENLEALGARRLAELLMDIAESDAATTRRLRLELAAQEAPEILAAELRKRFTQVALCCTQ